MFLRIIIYYLFIIPYFAPYVFIALLFNESHIISLNNHHQWCESFKRNINDNISFRELSFTLFFIISGLCDRSHIAFTNQNQLSIFSYLYHSYITLYISLTFYGPYKKYIMSISNLYYYNNHIYVHNNFSFKYMHYDF